MNNKIFKKIIKQIKKYDTIVIARHIGPDPDALGSTLGLKEIILHNYPNKQVYAVGSPASKFRYIGNVDKFNDNMYNNSLLILLDTPDLKRVDGLDPTRFSYSIKIDHHPFIESFCDIEYIDDSASSASQLVIELAITNKLTINANAAEKLFIGVIGDTDRFLYEYTTPKTFDLVSRMIKDTHLNFTSLYEPMYLRPMKEIKFQSYIAGNLIVTEHGFGYIKLDQDILDKYEVDAATAGNMVNNFNYIDGVYSWAVFSYDKNNDNIRGSIRSRGPIINQIAAQFGGGGHMYASGVRLSDFNKVDKLVMALDKACEEYHVKK